MYYALLLLLLMSCCVALCAIDTHTHAFKSTITTTCKSIIKYSHIYVLLLFERRRGEIVKCALVR